MDNQNKQPSDSVYQLQVVLLALLPALIVFVMKFSNGETAVTLGSKLGTMIGQAFFPMLFGLIAYTSVKKKTANKEGQADLSKARRKAILAIVITYVVLFLMFLSNAPRQ